MDDLQRGMKALGRVTEYIGNNIKKDLTVATNIMEYNILKYQLQLKINYNYRMINDIAKRIGFLHMNIINSSDNRKNILWNIRIKKQKAEYNEHLLILERNKHELHELNKKTFME